MLQHSKAFAVRLLGVALRAEAQIRVVPPTGRRGTDHRPGQSEDAALSTER